MVGIGSLQRCSTDTGSVQLSSQELTWGTPGRCPLCGVVTDHHWFHEVKSVEYDESREWVVDEMVGSQGEVLVSRCMSRACNALALWLKSADEESGIENVRLVYPQTGVRIPPTEGLVGKEIRLYEEAAAVEKMSPRAARALLRALLEAFLKRYLADAGHSAKRKKLVEVIDLAVKHLDLSPTLKMGLSAIREQGNTALHDPYSLIEAANPEDLLWLFQAVDELVEELHVRPQKWADLAGIKDDEPL